MTGPGQTATPDQVRMGRGLLGWTAYQLAARCGFGQHVIASFEGSGRVTASRRRTAESQRERLVVICGVLEEEGVEFTNDPGQDPGVRLKPQHQTGL